MNAESLRETYNKNFTASENNWTTSSKTRADKITLHVLGFLLKKGLSQNQNKLLDIGCATGFYSDAFHRFGFQVTGLDYSDVAVTLAKEKFPSCHFVQMNGFEPQFNSKFDIIFCKGFSGFNTHDLTFISTWVNKYLPFLNTGGFLVIGYSSNFTGKEKMNETVNHSRQELKLLQDLINANYRGQSVFHYFGVVSMVKKFLLRNFLRLNKKIEYYLYFQKS